MREWLEASLAKLSRKSDTAAAIHYALAHWNALMRYCDDGRIEIDNSAAERALRAVSIGRKNYLFAGSDRGGERAATFFALIGSVGLIENLAEFYPEARWQRCVVHFYRNVWTKVPGGKVKEVAAMLKAIHAQEDRDAAREKARLVIEKLRAMKLRDAAELIEAGVEETLSYYAFPSEHWRSLRTNNPLERLNREIRRRTRVVGTFPDGRSALMLVAARLRYVAASRWGTRRYLNMQRLAQAAVA